MVIAERTLTYSAGAGDRNVMIRLNAPEKGRYGWRCVYSIGWPHQDVVSEAWGVDPMQALIVTLEKIGVDIYTSPYHESGQLFFKRNGNGYGFPVPKNGRGWLVGDDIRFFG